MRQRTQGINALRGHLAEFGIVAPQGRAHVARLALALDEAASALPAAVPDLAALLLGQIAALDAKIAGLDQEIRLQPRRDADAARLMTIPGVGPICAMAIQAFAPPMESFRCGRDFSAWLGLVPRQHSTGGKPRLGRISKMGQRDLRRRLVCGAMAQLRWAIRRGEIEDPWLAGMLARKPRMVVAVALANRMARIAWALTVNKQVYRAPAAARAGDERPQTVGDAGRTEDRVRANGRPDGIGKTSHVRRALKHGSPSWTRSAHLHTGPRRSHAATRGRTHGST